MQKLRIGIPKGSLQDATILLFKKAGFTISLNERSYKPIIDDPEIECLLIRAQEIPKYVENGVLDVGISGEDWIRETSANIEEVADLIYSKQGFRRVKLVIATSEISTMRSVKDLEGKRIATELVNITKDYLKQNNVTAEVEFSWGATEAKVPELVDAIVELVDTGTSLRANNLRIIDTILESSTKLISNRKSMTNAWKKQKIENITLLLRGALEAEGKVGLKMNLPKQCLEKFLSSGLPALKSPTISQLADDKYLAIETIIEERIVRGIIPKLKELGAQDIIEYPLNKIIR